MFAKIEISGTIEIVTGLHIGGSSAFSAIGAVDSPVIMDTRSEERRVGKECRSRWSPYH